METGVASLRSRSHTKTNNNDSAMIVPGIVPTAGNIIDY